MGRPPFADYMDQHGGDYHGTAALATGILGEMMYESAAGRGVELLEVEVGDADNGGFTVKATTAAGQTLFIDLSTEEVIESSHGSAEAFLRLITDKMNAAMELAGPTTDEDLRQAAAVDEAKDD